MNIRFTADSTCDLNPALIERYQVEIIPLRIELNGKYYTDGVDISPDDILSSVNGGSELPKTSAINVAEYREVFQRLLKDCDAVIHFNISSDFSSCYQNACMAAEGLNVHCIDSRNLSSGIALLLAEAGDRAAAGMDVEGIIGEVGALIDRVDVSFIVDRLDYLYKGGRCSMLTMLGANMLHIRPCIEVKGGKMVVGRKYRGTYERCLRQYLADCFKTKESIDPRRVILAHTGISHSALETIRSIVASEMDFAEVQEVRAGCSITSHCGENTFGIILLRR